MTASMLGKRSRASVVEADVTSTPLKRTRQSSRTFVVNDENQDPKSVSFEDALAADISAAHIAKPRKASRSVAISPIKASPAKSAVPLTPSTPRFRDGLASACRSVSTPATPVTPSTPRHRVMSVGRISRRATPHGLSAEIGDTVPMTPRTPSAAQTVYHVARQLFSRSSGAAAGSLVGRETERARLQSFLYDNCTSAESKATKANCGCLYVSGPPGTGKSAMVNEMTEQVSNELSGSVRKAYINCMSIRSSNDLYSTLLRMLVADPAADIIESNAVDALQTILLPKNKNSKSAKTTPTAADTSLNTYLVVLDEIDHILTLDLESLYRVIEWSMIKTSRLVLVGIANALDLTDRFLPRLKSRNLQPELLPFLPYTAPQIKNIITTRLKSILPAQAPGSTLTVPANFLPFFHPAAIELCSRKVASQTGDLRKAFEILRRALDVVEAEARDKYLNSMREAQVSSIMESPSTPSTPSRKQPLGENKNLALSPSTATSTSASTSTFTQMPKRSTWASWAAQNLTVESAPRVSIGHLNKVTSAAFGNGTQQRLKGLNLQQKAALCALMAFEKWNRETHAAAQAASSLSSMVSPNGVKKLVRVPRTPSSSANGATSAPTIKKLFNTYSQMCKRDAILHPLSSSEFREVVGSLETLSLVTAVDGRTGSFAVLQSAPGSGRRGRRPGGAIGGACGGASVTGVAGDEKRIASCVGEKELEDALEGPGEGILRSILSGEALD